MAEKRIVIIGAGIVGCCTAYYLSTHPSFEPGNSTITILEASRYGPAQGASGKAGGLVAKWAYPKELVDVSFSEHVKLAEQYNGKERWGWRYVSCGSWSGRAELFPAASTLKESKIFEKRARMDDPPQKSSRSSGLPHDLDWVMEELTDEYSQMAPDGHTAQVHPYLFTTSMLSLAQERGVIFIPGKVTSIEQSAQQVQGVTYVNLAEPEKGLITLPATHVIVCAGAWSPSLVRNLDITTTRAHSITIHPAAGVTISPYVLFTEIEGLGQNRRQRASPEVYARPDNEIYVCGPGDDMPLPPTVDDVAVDDKAIHAIIEQAGSISQQMREGTVDKKQACYLPLGGPLIGEIRKQARGLYIATGHTCWGICNAPGTGRAISELVMDGKIKCAKLKKLEPL